MPEADGRSIDLSRSVPTVPEEELQGLYGYNETQDQRDDLP